MTEESDILAFRSSSASLPIERQVAPENDPRVASRGALSVCIGNPVTVQDLNLPFNADLFQHGEARKGFAASHVLSFLPTQLRTLRKCEGLSQKDLAKRLKTQQSAISRLEQVDNGNLNITTAIEIGDALDRPFIAYWGTYSELVSHVARAEEYPSAFLATPAYRHDPGFHAGKPPIPCSENHQLRSVQQVLFNWLDHPKPDHKFLLRLISGYDIPPSDDLMPPYQLLVAALREWGLTGSARQIFFTAVGKCVTDLLDALCGDTEFDCDPEALFHLCALFPEPMLLSTPLNRCLLEFESLRIRGKDISIDVRSAFTSALFNNQHSAELIGVLAHLARNPTHHPVLYSSPQEIQHALRVATKFFFEPSRQVETFASVIYATQLHEREERQAKSNIKYELSDTLVAKQGPSAEKERFGGALVFSGAVRHNWVTRTVKWTIDVLRDDFQVDVRSCGEFLTLDDPKSIFFRQNLLRNA